jgi:hypothetical protein
MQIYLLYFLIVSCRLIHSNINRFIRKIVILLVHCLNAGKYNKITSKDLISVASNIKSVIFV